MGAWDATSFGNDTANDWAEELEDCGDFAHIEAAFKRIEDLKGKYIITHDGEVAVAAAEVLAWLRGKPSESDAYTEVIADWVAAHPLAPSAELLARARAVLDRLRTEPSELMEVWEGDAEWVAAMDDLSARLS